MPVCRTVLESSVSWYQVVPSCIKLLLEPVVLLRCQIGAEVSETERLEDVDVAIELLPKVSEEAEFRKWCDKRRYAAREQGSAS
jgi:hypothetical protein